MEANYKKWSIKSFNTILKSKSKKGFIFHVERLVTIWFMCHRTVAKVFHEYKVLHISGTVCWY